MEQSWMNEHHVNVEYKKEVSEILQFTYQKWKTYQWSILLSLHLLSKSDTSMCEIDYVTFKVLVSKCRWVDDNICVRKYEFTLVDLNKVGDKDESFVMTYQAR